VLRDLLENFGRAFNQCSRAAFCMSVRHEIQPEITDTASKIATQRDYGYLVSVSTAAMRETGLPVDNRANSFLSGVICRFLGRWQPNVCHEAVTEMSSSDEGTGTAVMIDLGSAVVLDKLFGLYRHVVPRS